MKTFLTILALLSAFCHPERTAAQQKGASPLSSQQGNSGGITRAVVIGISDYQDPGIPDLRFADRDAEAFANFLRSPAGGSLDGDHLKVLLNSEATAAQFAIALDWLMEETKEGDQAIIYFSGHGDVEKKTLTQPGFLLCWDAPSRVYMAGGAFNLRDMQEIVSTLSIQNKAKVVVITDACRSGTLAGHSIGGAQATAANLAKQYANEIKILSCQPNEYSIEGEQWGGGRGAFSFNLVEALYGFADSNNDLFVTLQEVGRYLEDNVTAEVAPISQVPMVIGNRTERLAAVDAQLLADLRAGRTNQMKMLSSIESRGLEEDMLATVDSTVREVYRLFKKSLKERVLLEPATACADAYYARLIAEPKLARLHSTMTRNFAAALQDDAQQAINIWLSNDFAEFKYLPEFQKIPSQIERSMELLGEGHYMYRTLQARLLLFKGIALSEKNNYKPNEQLGRQMIDLYRQSAAIEPNSPIPTVAIGFVYACEIWQPDSAFLYVQKALEQAPSWVYAYLGLSRVFMQNGHFDHAKLALEKISPEHHLHTLGWIIWHYNQEGKSHYEATLQWIGAYESAGHPEFFPLKWVRGHTLIKLKRYKEAEQILTSAYLQDSTELNVLNTLSLLYRNTGRHAEAIVFTEKAIAIDSTNIWGWYLLGYSYIASQQYSKAVPVQKKLIALDSTDVASWNNLGYAHLHLEEYAEAEEALKKAISVDTTYTNSRKHLGMVYFKTNRPEEARQLFQKSMELDPNYVPAMLAMAYLLASEGKTEEAVGYVEQAVGKGMPFGQLVQDEDLAPLRATPAWEALMEKYIPDQAKD